MASFSRVAMCRPTHFTVEYAINPWMGGIVDKARAMVQWESLKSAIEETGTPVDVIEQQPNLPDQVFACNAGIVYGKRVFLAQFRHPERQPERLHFADWFLSRGFEVMGSGRHVYEGGGDSFFTDSGVLFAGAGQRSDPAVYEDIKSTLPVVGQTIDVVPIRISNPKFYHLDTCLFPLDSKSGVFYSGAFDSAIQQRIRAHLPDLIDVTEEDAKAFACNGFSVPRAKTVILPAGSSKQLQADLEKRGWQTVLIEMDEFMKSGGACQCLVLKMFDA